MPNWCDTTYYLIGSKESLDKINDILERMRNGDYKKNKSDYGMWLGDFIELLGGNPHHVSCRGEIQDFYYDDDNGELKIWQATAWREQEGVRKTIEQRFPDVKVYFQDIELGCGWLTTNDETGQYFPEEYYVDSLEEPYYCDSLEEARSVVEDMVGYPIDSDFKAIEKAAADFNKQHENDDEFIYIYKFHLIKG